MPSLFLFTIVYLIPTFIMFYMSIDIFLRNPSRPQHRLLSLFTFAYLWGVLPPFKKNASSLELTG